MSRRSRRIRRSGALPSAAIIAVAAGLTDVAGLEAAGAHVVLPNLEDVDRVIGAIEDRTAAVGRPG